MDEDLEGNVTEEAMDQQISKLDSLTLSMCSGLFNSGCTVNMDNYYMSTTCALRLQQNGVLCRGTIRSSRKFVPKSILFTCADIKKLPRGSQRVADNRDRTMIAIGWIDIKPVHFISIADSTAVVTVMRRVGREKVEVSAPIAIRNYNKFMGGVDIHDRLHSTFSICKKHKFKKYYVKLFLFLLDVGITNAWIYYKLSRPEMKDRGTSRAEFYQLLAESLVNPSINWNDRYGEHIEK
jgi:hypothetical protein